MPTETDTAEQSAPTRAAATSRLRGRVGFPLAAAAITGIFFCIAVLLGHGLLLSGHLWTEATVLGFDPARNIHTLAEPGPDDRTNVHPLLGVTTKPVARLIQHLGITPGTSAIIINAGAAALGLFLTALYLRRRGVSGGGALVGMLFMAGSSIWIFEAAVPGSYIFHVWTLAALSLVLVWCVREPQLPARGRWLRELLWLGIGVINYGYTVLCGIYSFIFYGFARTGRRRWPWAVLHGAAVLALGLLFSWLAGSDLNAWRERHWIVEPAFHGQGAAHPFLDSLSAHLVWSVVAPDLVGSNPQVGWSLQTILGWDYPAWMWLLAGGWLLILAAATWAVLAERRADERRLNQALLLGLAFQVAFHSFYYVTGEGVYDYAGHSQFMLIGLLAPLLVRIDRLPAASARRVKIVLALFALALAARHIAVCHNFQFTIPLPKK